MIKRSVCIEGARRALARAKVHWGKLDAEKLVKDGPPAFGGWSSDFFARVAVDGQYPN